MNFLCLLTVADRKLLKISSTLRREVEEIFNTQGSRPRPLGGFSSLYWGDGRWTFYCFLFICNKTFGQVKISELLEKEKVLVDRMHLFDFFSVMFPHCFSCFGEVMSKNLVLYNDIMHIYCCSEVFRKTTMLRGNVIFRS